MRLKNLLESPWNEADKEAAKNAQPNLDKATETHNKLVSKRDELQKKITTISHQESGQGQRGGEVEELKSKIKDLNDEVSESEVNIHRLTRIRDGILQMKKG